MTDHNDVATIRAAFDGRHPDARTIATIRRGWHKRAEDSARRRGDTATADHHRTIAKAISLLSHQHRNTRLREIGAEGGTPETTAQAIPVGRSRGNPVERLYLAGHIDNAAVRASNEISEIHHAIASAVGGKVQKYEPGIITAGGMPEWLALQHSYVYWPWCLQVGPDHLAMVLEVVVDGKSPRRVRGLYRVRDTAIVKIVADALKLYARISRGFDPERPERSPTIAEVADGLGLVKQRRRDAAPSR
jgi:hypothetical protein